MLRLIALLFLAAPAFAATPDAGVKPRMAVLYFDASTTDADLTAFTKGLAALLITDFTANPGLQVRRRLPPETPPSTPRRIWLVTRVPAVRIADFATDSIAP